MTMRTSPTFKRWLVFMMNSRFLIQCYWKQAHPATLNAALHNEIIKKGAYGLHTWQKSYQETQSQVNEEGNLGMNAIGKSLLMRGYNPQDKSIELQGIVVSTTCNGWKKQRLECAWCHWLAFYVYTVTVNWQLCLYSQDIEKQRQYKIEEDVQEETALIQWFYYRGVYQASDAFGDVWRWRYVLGASRTVQERTWHHEFQMEVEVRNVQHYSREGTSTCTHSPSALSTLFCVQRVRFLFVLIEKNVITKTRLYICLFDKWCGFIL